MAKITDEQVRGHAADVIYGDDAFGLEEDGVAGKYKADSHSMYYDFVKANEDPSMMEEYIAQHYNERWKLERDAFQLKRNQVGEYGREIEEQRRQQELLQK